MAVRAESLRRTLEEYSRANPKARISDLLRRNNDAPVKDVKKALDSKIPEVSLRKFGKTPRFVVTATDTNLDKVLQQSETPPGPQAIFAVRCSIRVVIELRGPMKLPKRDVLGRVPVEVGARSRATLTNGDELTVWVESEVLPSGVLRLTATTSKDTGVILPIVTKAAPSAIWNQGDATHIRGLRYDQLKFHVQSPRDDPNVAILSLPAPWTIQEAPPFEAGEMFDATWLTISAPDAAARACALSFQIARARKHALEALAKGDYVRFRKLRKERADLMQDARKHYADTSAFITPQNYWTPTFVDTAVLVPAGNDLPAAPNPRDRLAARAVRKRARGRQPAERTEKVVRTHAVQPIQRRYRDDKATTEVTDYDPDRESTKISWVSVAVAVCRQLNEQHEWAWTSPCVALVAILGNRALREYHNPWKILDGVLRNRIAPARVRVAVDVTADGIPRDDRDFEREVKLDDFPGYDALNAEVAEYIRDNYMGLTTAPHTRQSAARSARMVNVSDTRHYVFTMFNELLTSRLIVRGGKAAGKVLSECLGWMSGGDAFTALFAGLPATIGARNVDMGAILPCLLRGSGRVSLRRNAFRNPSALTEEPNVAALLQESVHAALKRKRRLVRTPNFPVDGVLNWALGVIASSVTNLRKQVRWDDRSGVLIFKTKTPGGTPEEVVERCAITITKAIELYATVMMNVEPDSVNLPIFLSHQEELELRAIAPSLRASRKRFAQRVRDKYQVLPQRVHRNRTAFERADIITQAVSRVADDLRRRSRGSSTFAERLLLDDAAKPPEAGRVP